jgi:hypothetical protein
MFFALRRSASQQREIERPREVIKQRFLQELDEALAHWLLTLGLPQLEEQTKREEAAHQLSTVLIEKLMRRRLPQQTSTADPRH